MADTDSKEICEYCKFWEYTGHAGECHRYPNAIVKYQSHWCGEFLGKIAVAPLPTLAVGFSTPKRGRPAKNA